MKIFGSSIDSGCEGRNYAERRRKAQGREFLKLRPIALLTLSVVILVSIPRAFCLEDESGNEASDEGEIKNLHL